eukprot:gene2833-1818_t
MQTAQLKTCLSHSNQFTRYRYQTTIKSQNLRQSRQNSNLLALNLTVARKLLLNMQLTQALTSTTFINNFGCNTSKLIQQPKCISLKAYQVKITAKLNKQPITLRKVSKFEYTCTVTPTHSSNTVPTTTIRKQTHAQPYITKKTLASVTGSSNHGTYKYSIHTNTKIKALPEFKAHKTINAYPSQFSQHKTNHKILDTAIYKPTYGYMSCVNT